jgi:hypothetical protein
MKTEEVHSEQEQMKQKVFDELIEKRCGTSNNPPSTEGSSDSDNSGTDFKDSDGDDEEARIVPNIEDRADANRRLLNQMPAYDRILNAELSLQTGAEMSVGKLIQHALGPDGTEAGTYDKNPIINTMIYDVEFRNGDIKEYAANIIAKILLTQVDSDGYSLTMMKRIIDYKRDDAVAVPKSDMQVITNRGQKKLRKATIGWKLLVQWADNSKSWIPLKDKESHPVQVAEILKARDIANKPAFVWWVPYTLRMRDNILPKIKARTLKTTHKYGVKVPTGIKHAYKLDQENANTLWRDALALERIKIGVAFEVLVESQRAPPAWSKVTGHLIWDLKMDFTKKARWDSMDTKHPTLLVLPMQGLCPETACE